MTSLSLDKANILIAAALEKGRAMGLKPLSVAVLDAGGHLIAFQRETGASILRPQIAVAKASGALALGVSSRKIADMAADRPTFIASLGPIAPSGIVPAAGGVILIDEHGATIGAMGVTGDTSDNDELCALAAITTALLKAQA